MQKTINVDGKKIVLKTNGLVPLIYKKEFKRDFFADIHALNTQKSDIEILYNLAWVYAKAADEEILPLYEWLESFESFPIMLYRKTILELTVACISVSGSNQKKTRTAKQG